jgi:hypothetical protein
MYLALVLPESAKYSIFILLRSGTVHETRPTSPTAHRTCRNIPLVVFKSHLCCRHDEIDRHFSFYCIPKEGTWHRHTIFQKDRFVAGCSRQTPQDILARTKFETLHAGTMAAIRSPRNLHVTNTPSAKRISPALVNSGTVSSTP